jgi:hypothetical protein
LAESISPAVSYNFRFGSSVQLPKLGPVDDIAVVPVVLDSQTIPSLSG